jgi:hypothetical protein
MTLQTVSAVALPLSALDAATTISISIFSRFDIFKSPSPGRKPTRGAGQMRDAMKKHRAQKLLTGQPGQCQRNAFIKTVVALDDLGLLVLLRIAKLTVFDGNAGILIRCDFVR